MSFLNQDNFADVITTPPRLNTTDPLNPDTTATLNSTAPLKTDPLNPDANAEEEKKKKKQENARRNPDNSCDCYCCLGFDTPVNTTDDSDCCLALCCTDFWSDCGNFLGKCCCCCCKDDGCGGDTDCCCAGDSGGEATADLCAGCGDCDCDLS